jgi:hypothetical protein
MTGTIKPKELDVVGEYAYLMVLMRLYLQAFNLYDFNQRPDPATVLSHPEEDKANRGYQLYKALDFAKDDIKYSQSAVNIFWQRFFGDSSIQQAFVNMADDIQGMNMPPIKYNFEGAPNTPLDKEKARIIYLATSGLMNLLEEIYMNSTLILAASGAANNYEYINEGNLKQGTGTNGF